MWNRFRVGVTEESVRHAPRDSECRRFNSSDFPSDGLAERLRDHLCLVEVQSVHADLERGAAFLDYQTQAGPRRVAEIHVIRVVADAADRFHCDAGHCRRFAGVEAFYRTLATARLNNGQSCKPALPRPLTRRWTADRCPGIDWYLQRRTELCLGDQGAGFVGRKRPDSEGRQNDTSERNSECDRAHLRSP